MIKNSLFSILLILFLVFSFNASAWLDEEETFSDGRGTTYTIKGSSVYSNTGIMYTGSEGTISGSDDSSYQKTGNTIYKNGVPFCYISGKQIFCDED